MSDRGWSALLTTSSAAERPRALLVRLAELLTALDPHELDPERSGVVGAEGGSVSVRLRHRSEDLLDITVDCYADGFASVDAPAGGAPEEFWDLEHQSLDDWCADILDSVVDGLLRDCTLTDESRDGRLLCTRLSIHNPEIAGSTIAAASWAGFLPRRRRNLQMTTRESGYDCRGTPPAWLLRSAVFVIDGDGLVTVYPHRSYAEASLEAVDIAGGEYCLAYDEHGVAYRVEAHHDHGLLVPTGNVDPQALVAALRSWPGGPVDLAGEPHAYAVHQLG